MPMRVSFKQSGSFNNTLKWLNRLKSGQIFATLNKYGSLGQNALSNATPTESGLASSSWTYTIDQGSTYYRIRWYNTDVEDGFHVAVMLQYGHGTGTGGYVQGRDYINPAMRPIFDQMVTDFWKEVTRI